MTMKREVLPDGTVIYSVEGGAAALTRLAPGFLLLRAAGSFESPATPAYMQDFDREIADHGSLTLFLDLWNRKNVASSSRQSWSDWAKQNRDRVRAHLLVNSKLVDMAISVMAMLAGGISIRSYSNPKAFEAAMTRTVPGLSRIPPAPRQIAVNDSVTR